MLDGHNCYPYDGKWTDRINRALSTGFPVSIEQDLAWYVDPANGRGRVVVSHTPHPTGNEPPLEHYFFERVKPIIEQALRENHPDKWPLIILHFDFKDEQPPVLHTVWNLLGKHESWISTAKKNSDPRDLSPIERRPLLVITEDSDAQEELFFKEQPIGAQLRLFGSAHTATLSAENDEQRRHLLATLPPEKLLSERPTNYRRWWNNSWYVVEEGGEINAGEWTTAKDERLKAVVKHAHQLGFWIRFYTLDGFQQADERGWGSDYNFGSLKAVQIRWKAALDAGVNFIATDQYEALAQYMKQTGYKR
ncbi:MAG: hypothetical protein JO033_06325 [Acidobacteriaceae bacterium]|nr:hypothetical protein [Acidobacteriaceae bacterium]